MLCDRARSPPHPGGAGEPRGGSMVAGGGAGAVASFPLSVERRGRSTTLDVPFTFAAPLRHARLTEWLGKERWTVRGDAAAAPASASPAGGATEAAVQAAELLFIRDVLGPLRLRPGAVPEKIVARLLAIGVMALHKRCEALFGQRWGDFLLARWPETSPAPSTSAPPPAPTPAPTASTATTAAATAAITALSPPPLLPIPSATAPPPLLPLPAASDADEGGEEPLLALLFGEPSTAACLVGGFEGAGDNADELELLLLPGGGCGCLALAAEAEAELLWEEALCVPPTPAGGSSGVASVYTLAAAQPAAAKPLALQLGLAPLVTLSEPALPSSQDAELAQLVAELAAPAAPAVPAAGAALLLPDELPEIPPCFSSADLAAELAAEAAASVGGAPSADLDFLRSCHTWDLFPPPPFAP